VEDAMATAKKKKITKKTTTKAKASSRKTKAMKKR
jgi:hypothetical protein